MTKKKSTLFAPSGAVNVSQWYTALCGFDSSREKQSRLSWLSQWQWTLQHWLECEVEKWTYLKQKKKQKKTWTDKQFNKWSKMLLLQKQQHLIYWLVKHLLCPCNRKSHNVFHTKCQLYKECISVTVSLRLMASTHGRCPSLEHLTAFFFLRRGN